MCVSLCTLTFYKPSEQPDCINEYVFFSMFVGRFQAFCGSTKKEGFAKKGG